MTSTPDLQQRQLDDILATYVATVTPLPHHTPSQWAEAYRRLDVAEAEQSGPWRNDVFPALAPIMDAGEECMLEGKRGVVVMKAAQGGCSQAIKNLWGWCETYYPGPAGYLISKDEMAKKFGRLRFDPMIRTTEPLRKKALLRHGGGTTLQEKVFTDGYLSIFGGRSVLNLQSIPYRFMFIDEVDSLLEAIDGSDPIELARKRTNSYVGETLIVAFGHPSVKGHGAGKLYYEESDQRRGYVPCRKCKKEFWFNWEYVQCEPPAGVELDKAKLDAANYVMRCPHCKVAVSDADRITMLRSLTYRSELSEADRAGRTWIGLHFNEFYYPHKPLRAIVEDFIACHGDDLRLRTFWNKTLGEPYEATVSQFSVDLWRKCIVTPQHSETARDRESFTRGQVPPGVSVLTAGQDSGKWELYWSIWGWARPQCRDGHRYLRGWLIDYGAIKREAASHTDLDMLSARDLGVLDPVLFDSRYATSRGDTMQVTQVGIDSGWQATSVYQYCARWPGRAVPVKGGSDRGLDYQRATKLIQWSDPISYNFNGMIVRSEQRIAVLNTCQLKLDFFNHASRRLDIGSRTLPVLSFPYDATENLFTQLSNERLTRDRKNGRELLVWQRTGLNHWLDTAIYAYACAVNLEPIIRDVADSPMGSPPSREPDPQEDAEESARALYRL